MPLTRTSSSSEVEVFRPSPGGSLRNLHSGSHSDSGFGLGSSRLHSSYRKRLRLFFFDLGRTLYLFFTGQLVIDPEGTFKRLWDMLIIYCVTYNVITVPWFIAFDSNLALEYLPVDVVLLILMSIDMLFVFRSGFIAFGGTMVFDSKEVAWRYIRSSKFTLDLLSVIPIEFVAWQLPHTINGDSRFTTEYWYALLKVKQLLRLHKLLDNPRLDESFQTPRLRVMKIFLAWMMLGHYFACLLVFVGTNQRNGDTWNWMINTGLDPKHNLRSELYIAGLYWSVVTMTVVGYGDKRPVTTPEQTVEICVLLSSLGFYTAVFSSIAASLTSFQHQARAYQKLMDSTKEFAAVNDLPKTLSRKMASYEAAQWNQTHGFTTPEVLHDLPESVQAEVLLYIHTSLIERCPFFAQCSSRFLDAVILRLKAPSILLEGDYLFREGDTTRSLYFIRDGEVEVLMDNPITQQSQVIARLTSKSDSPFVGELALLLGIARTASVRASEHTLASTSNATSSSSSKTNTVVYHELAREDFFDLLALFPEEELSLREEAAKRLQADFERIKVSAAAKQAAQGGGAGGRRNALTVVSSLGAIIMRRILRLEEGRLSEFGEPISSTRGEDSSSDDDDESDATEETTTLTTARTEATITRTRTLQHQDSHGDILAGHLRQYSSDLAAGGCGITSQTQYSSVDGTNTNPKRLSNPLSFDERDQALHQLVRSPSMELVDASITTITFPLPGSIDSAVNGVEVKSVTETPTIRIDEFDPPKTTSPPPLPHPISIERRNSLALPTGAVSELPPFDPAAAEARSARRRSDRTDLLVRLASSNSTRELLADSVARRASFNRSSLERRSSLKRNSLGGGEQGISPGLFDAVKDILLAQPAPAQDASSVGSASSRTAPPPQPPSSSSSTLPPRHTSPPISPPSSTVPSAATITSPSAVVASDSVPTNSISAPPPTTTSSSSSIKATKVSPPPSKRSSATTSPTIGAVNSKASKVGRTSGGKQRTPTTTPTKSKRESS